MPELLLNQSSRTTLEKHLSDQIGGITRSPLGVLKHPFLVQGGIFHADVVIPTPQGLIRSAWSRSGSLIKVKLSLPKGVVATVKLAGVKTGKVEGTSNWMVKA